MMDLPYSWRLLSDTAEGTRHGRVGKPNQDAVKVYPDKHQDNSLVHVLAVADGHGDDGIPRSRTGARLAVETAVETLREFALTMEQEKRAFKETLDLARTKLATEILEKWREKVLRDLEMNPLAPLDQADPREDEFERSRASCDIKAYGTTLVAVLLAKDFVCFLQLGDSTVHTVSDDAARVSPALQQDARNFGNTTTSLGSSTAVSDMRIDCLPLEALEDLAMIMLCTDGYQNAFEPDVFQEVCREFLRDLRQPDGVARVRGYLPDCLKEASALGTGDDATIAIAFREASRDATSGDDGQAVTRSVLEEENVVTSESDTGGVEDIEASSDAQSPDGQDGPTGMDGELTRAPQLKTAEHSAEAPPESAQFDEAESNDKPVDAFENRGPATAASNEN